MSKTTLIPRTRRRSTLLTVLVLLLLPSWYISSASGSDLGHQTIPMYAPYAEWSLVNPSYTGNAFDLEATVTFISLRSNRQITTGMFYDGNDIWKFRFTGVEQGRWRFTTMSRDPELDGHSGFVTVQPHPNPSMEGFLTHQGNQFAIQKGNNAQLAGYSFTVFMNQYLGRKRDWLFHQLGKDLNTAAKAWNAYLDNAFTNGFEIVHLEVANSWFSFPAYRSDEHESTHPDIYTFRLLETCIKLAHARGGRVHIWAWGDDQRKATPVNVGGINGPADRRIQRYIAARLGPLPGWTLGYGFDLWEWTTLDQVKAWATYLQAQFGWPHLLAARGWHLADIPFTMVSYGSFGRDAIRTTIHGPKSYREILLDLKIEPDQPHLYEERHSYKRPKFALDMKGTRRMLWRQTMAGGMGGFFGFYANSPHPYPDPEQLRTHYSFWHQKGRLLLGMAPANELTNGYCLSAPNSKQYIFYGESTSLIHMNLSDMKGEQPAVAVDLTTGYKEIQLGRLLPGSHDWKAPYTADWAIAVGHFSISPDIAASTLTR